MARALYYNVRGTASVPLGPSVTMRGADAPFAFYKLLIGSGHSTLAPRHSKHTSRSTILNKCLGVGLAIEVSKEFQR